MVVPWRLFLIHPLGIPLVFTSLVNAQSFVLLAERLLFDPFGMYLLNYCQRCD